MKLIPDGPVMPSLYTLDLSGNEFGNTFPSWLLTDVPSLHILHLQNNLFNGTLYLTKSTTVTYLNVANNYITTVQTDEVVFNLQTLNLQNNQLTDLQFLCNLTQIGACTFPTLLSIDLSLDMLKGSICQICSPLISLDLSYNNLAGNIDNIERIVGLVTINLNNNMLNGNIPALNHLQYLAELYLNNNEFEGTIPSMLPMTLTTLEIANNELNGTIPEQLGNLALSSLNLFNTSLCGCFPSQWINIVWESCNINGFPHNCNCTLNNCKSNCDVYNTISCDGQPCKSSQCTHGRVCLPDNGGFGYYCSGNCSLLYVPSVDSPFTCDMDSKVVLGLEIVVPFLFLLTTISCLCAIFPRRKKIDNNVFINYRPV